MESGEQVDDEVKILQCLSTWVKMKEGENSN